jgi:phosphoglycerate dehydrogenase-like enzyme
VRLDYLEAGEEIRPEQVADADALILLTPRFSRASIHPNGRLAVVARFGVGYDNVDVEACSEHGIALTITPDGVRRPVAVTVITFILALSQKLLIKDRLCRQGPPGWAARVTFMGEGLIGKTLGQLGMGNIGAEVFRMAAPFGLNFIAHDPFIDKAKAAELGVEVVSSDELFRRSDFLSVSVPLSDATRHYVNAARLKLMKPTAYLINTARGPLVDYEALYRALAARKLRGAMLETFAEEPAPPDWPLLSLPNVTLTPHIAGASLKTVKLAAAMMAEEVRRYIAGESPLNPC